MRFTVISTNSLINWTETHFRHSYLDPDVEVMPEGILCLAQLCYEALANLINTGRMISRNRSGSSLIGK